MIVYVVRTPSTSQHTRIKFRAPLIFTLSHCLSPPQTMVQRWENQRKKNEVFLYAGLATPAMFKKNFPKQSSSFSLTLEACARKGGSLSLHQYFISVLLLSSVAAPAQVAVPALAPQPSWLHETVQRALAQSCGEG